MKLSAWEGERQSGEDLHRKFHGTYVFAKVGDTPPGVIFIHSIANGVEFSTPDGRMQIATRDQVDILKALPDAGLYALEGGGVALVRKTGERQWREGMCTSTISVLINGDKPILKDNINFSLAAQLFAEQKDLTLDEGKQAVRDGKCVRLNRDFWLKKEKDATVMLFFRRARVGSWAASGRWFWSASAKCLQEEVKDKLGFNHA